MAIHYKEYAFSIYRMLLWRRTPYYGIREAYYIGDPNQYCIVYTILDANPDVRNAADDLNDAGKIPISVRICINAKNGDILEIYQNDACWDFPDRLGI